VEITLRVLGGMEALSLACSWNTVAMDVAEGGLASILFLITLHIDIFARVSEIS